MKADAKLFDILSEKTRNEINEFSDLLSKLSEDDEVNKKFSDLIHRVVVESYYTSKEKITFNKHGKG